jgi:exopolyphosphatase/guanosine-5'-triphosphate,3'-diphosphate pyrophosphatase
MAGTAQADWLGGRGKHFAALDLGTNNCRLLIAAQDGAGFRVVDRFSRAVRLGEGLASSGALSAAAMERAMAALRACAARLGRLRVRHLRAIATEACRSAANGAEFLARVRRETGLPITVISTREEAELALESCAPLLTRGVRRALLFDIGGGSTEIVWIRLGEDGQPVLIGYDSLPVGVVTLSERFGANAFSAEGFAAMEAMAGERLARFEGIHRIGLEIRAGGVALLGTSGTVTTLAGVALGLARYQRSLIDGAELTRDTAFAAVQQLRLLTPDALALHPNVGAGRVAFVLPGCAIFSAIAKAWPAARILVADRGLREGMLVRMMRAADGSGVARRQDGGWR